MFHIHLFLTTTTCIEANSHKGSTEVKAQKVPETTYFQSFICSSTLVKNFLVKKACTASFKEESEMSNTFTVKSKTLDGDS